MMTLEYLDARGVPIPPGVTQPMEGEGPFEIVLQHPLNGMWAAERITNAGRVVLTVSRQDSEGRGVRIGEVAPGETKTFHR